MATMKSSAPSFFNFLKEGLLLPTHNRRLFAAVFAVMVASTSLLLLGNNLAVRPLEDEIRLDTKVLNSTEPASSNYLHLLQEIKDTTRELWLTRGVYLLASAVVSSAVRIVVLFAAVATYSGELHTFASILGEAKGRLKGPALTIALAYTPGIACVGLLAAMALVPVLVTDVMIKQHLALFLVGLPLFLVACIFLACSLLYLSFLCSLGVVVAVAEPGCHGAGAVGRAWRLVKGKRGRAMLFILVTAFLLPAALSPVQALFRRCALGNVAAGLLLRLLYTILSDAVALFSMCALTAFYFECKGSIEAAATEYIEVSTKEQIDV